MPPHLDDNLIDDIIWEAIADSPSRGDFICYTVHAPIKAKHLQEADTRIREIDPERDMVPVAYGKAIERIRKLADDGDATAMFHMGKIHAIGISVPQNLPSAVSWYKKAIAKGEPRAFANLGWFYQSGYGVPKSPKKAFNLLSIGAEKGIHSARVAVGMMLLAGEGCDADSGKGIQMLEEAFEAGQTDAGNHLADTYFAGEYVPRDIERGHDWLFKVAERGDERTMAFLGHYLVAGTHGKTDIPKGLALLEAATGKNFLSAFLWLGSLYRNGTGVEQNPDIARAWYERGIASGSSECEQALERMLLENYPGLVKPDKPSLH